MPLGHPRESHELPRGSGPTKGQDTVDHQYVPGDPHRRSRETCPEFCGVVGADAVPLEGAVHIQLGAELGDAWVPGLPPEVFPGKAPVPGLGRRRVVFLVAPVVLEPRVVDRPDLIAEGPVGEHFRYRPDVGFHEVSYSGLGQAGQPQDHPVEGVLPGVLIDLVHVVLGRVVRLCL